MTFIYLSERTKRANLSEPVNKTNLSEPVNILSKSWQQNPSRASMPATGEATEGRGYLEQGEGQDWQQHIIIIIFSENTTFKQYV